MTKPQKFMSIPPGIHSLHVKHNTTYYGVNCPELSKSITITEPTQLTNNGAITNSKCYNEYGSIINYTTGGNGGFNYKWSTGESTKDISVKAGVYYLTVTDSKNCKTNPTSQSFSVSQPNQLKNDATITNALCFNSQDGKIDNMTTGGNGGYKFLWDDGSNVFNRTNLKAGIYKVTITDSKDCKTLPESLEYEVKEPEKISNDDGVKDDIKCYGETNGSISLFIQGGIVPYRYLWNGGQITPYLIDLSKGEYSCIVKDKNNCVETFKYQINEPPIINVSAQVNPKTPSSNGSIIINSTGGVGLHLYHWTGPNGFTSSDKNIYNLEAGDYVLTVKDENLCLKTFNYNITFLNAVAFEKLDKIVFTLTNNKIIVQNLAPSKEAFLKLYNIDGKNLHNTKMDSNQSVHEINISYIPDGIYLVE